MSGLVSLVGAGCAPGLITELGLERLTSCDAVVYDDLIDPELLRRVPERAERIYMGKRSGRPSAGQAEICETLVRLALEGKRVVRLKGGDPYVFGRGGEEMLALGAAGVTCEEVPGVTSAVAVPAIAGIPLTHRALSRGFAVVTAHTADDDALPEYFASLAHFPGTLVILMGLAKLARIAQYLTGAGMDAETPCAVVSEGCASERCCVRGTLENIAQRAAFVKAPAIIVVGAVAEMELGAGTRLPLAHRRIALTGTRRMNEKLARELVKYGAEPFTACELVLSPLPEADDTPTDCDCLAFTSAVGVELYFERLLRSGRDARALAGVRVAAIGRATARALAQHSVAADIVPEEQTTAGLAAALVRELAPGAGVCLYRSAQGDAALKAALERRFKVREVRAYTARAGEYAAPEYLIATADAAAFTSAAGARIALERLGALDDGALLAALGEPTARALQGRKNPVVVADEPSAASLAKAIADKFM